MQAFLLIVCVYLLIGVILRAWLTVKRQGAKVTGPYETPDGVLLFVVWDDPLADLLKTHHANAVTILNHVGLSDLASTGGEWADWSIYHEHEHVGQQCWPVGSKAPIALLEIVGVITGPVVIFLSLIGLFEVGPTEDGNMMKAHPIGDVFRKPWTDLAATINADRPK